MWSLKIVNTRICLILISWKELHRTLAMFARSRASTVLSDFFPPEQSVKAKNSSWLLFAAWQGARKTISAAEHNIQKQKL